VFCKSTCIHFHHFTSSRPPSPKKNPQGLGGQGKTASRGKQHPIKEANHSRVIFSSQPFLSFLIAISRFTFLCSQPRLASRGIFGIEEVPKHILSDSSAEEEDATPEQRTNHQLRRRIRHLEHDLWDITACCSAERERRMSLEALVGGKILILI
jgi:hypothetical protein